MKVDNKIEAYNYRVIVLFKSHITGEEKLYTVEFPEFWLAKKYAESLQDDESIIGIYLSVRTSDDNFDIIRRYK